MISLNKRNMQVTLKDKTSKCFFNVDNSSAVHVVQYMLLGDVQIGIDASHV